MIDWFVGLEGGWQILIGLYAFCSATVTLWLFLSTAADLSKEGYLSVTKGVLLLAVCVLLGLLWPCTLAAGLIGHLTEDREKR